MLSDLHLTFEICCLREHTSNISSDLFLVRAHHIRRSASDAMVVSRRLRWLAFASIATKILSGMMDCVKYIQVEAVLAYLLKIPK